MKKFLRIHILILTAGLGLASVQAADPDLATLIPRLAGTNMAARTTALASLHKMVVEAGSPGRDEDRKAVSLALCASLQEDPPVLAALDLVRQLGHIGDDESVDTLAGLMAHPDARLRDDARRALEVNPSPRAGEALRDQLGRADSPRDIAGILQALGQRGEVDAVPAIAARLAVGNTNVYRAAVAALSALGGRQACDALAKARQPTTPDLSIALLDAAYSSFLKDDTETAASVYTSLTKPGEPEAIRAHAFRGLALAQPDRAAEIVALVMAQPSESCQVAVIEAADVLRNQAEPISSLIRDLDAMTPAVQTLALRAVHGNLVPGLESEVHRKLLSGPAEVTVAAAEALQRLGRSTSVEPLLQAMAVTGPGATAAASALERMSAPGVNAALLATATGGDAATRVLAIKVLAGRTVTSAIPELISILKDPDPSVSKAAGSALRTLATPTELPVLANALRDPMPEAAGKALLGAVITAIRKSDNPEKMASPLVGALNGADAPARARLLQALGEAGGPLALESEVAALADKSETVRQTAVKTLVRWKGQEALPHLVAIAADKSAAMTDHVASLQGALRLLKEGQDSSLATQKAGELISIARRPEEKNAALDLLSAASGPASLEIIARNLADEDIGPRAAEMALGLVPSIFMTDRARAKELIKELHAQAPSEEIRTRIRAMFGRQGLVDGWLVNWEVSGPYTGGDLFNQAYAPEQDTPDVTWRKVETSDRLSSNPFIVNLLAKMPGQNRVAYLRSVIEWPVDGPAMLEVGSDDGVKIWINGALVHSNNVSRGCVPGSDKVAVSLKAKRNTVVVKVVQRAGDWAFVARLVNAAQP